MLHVCPCFVENGRWNHGSCEVLLCSCTFSVFPFWPCSPQHCTFSKLSAIVPIDLFYNYGPVAQSSRKTHDLFLISDSLHSWSWGPAPVYSLCEWWHHFHMRSLSRLQWNICRGWRLVFPVVCRGYQHTLQLYWFLIRRHETEQVFGHGHAVCGLWSEHSLSVFSGLSQWCPGLGFQPDSLHADLYSPLLLYFWITVSTEQPHSWRELDPMGNLEIQLSTEVEGWVHHTTSLSCPPSVQD